MSKTTKATETKQVSDSYLETLTEVKKQYQQYVEVSKLYELPAQKESAAPQYQPPALNIRLPHNTFRVK